MKSRPRDSRLRLDRTTLRRIALDERALAQVAGGINLGDYDPPDRLTAGRSRTTTL